MKKSKTQSAEDKNTSNNHLAEREKNNEKLSENWNRTDAMLFWKALMKLEVETQ